MSGDKVWVHGAVERDQVIAAGQNLMLFLEKPLLGA